MSTQTNRLVDLILLAERGLGLRRCDTFAKVWQDPSFSLFATSDEQVYLAHKFLRTVEAWMPYTHLRDAGLLMRELGVYICPGKDRAGKVTCWGAGPLMLEDGCWHESDEPTIIDGNTEAAQCTAICECALKIIREKP